MLRASTEIEATVRLSSKLFACFLLAADGTQRLDGVSASAGDSRNIAVVDKSVVLESLQFHSVVAIVNLICRSKECERAMRDIRSDLQERATLIDEQIKGAYDHFERSIRQLQNERDARISELQSAISMIAKFIEFEDRNMPNVTQTVPSSPLVAFADRVMQALNDAGRMTRQELIDMAVKAGFFSDAESATQGIHPMLIGLVRSELIRELPNGAFAPPTMSQAIKLRRVG